MSLSDVENAIKDAEALKFYDSMKENNATLEEEGHRLKIEKSEMQTRYEDRIMELENQLAQEKGVRITYKKAHYTPKEFDRLVASRVEREHHADINRKVRERWVAEAPGLVREAVKKEILSYPSSCSPETRTTIETQAIKHAETILRNRLTWPQWFQTYYRQEVNTGVQNGLDKAFNDSVDKKAAEEIHRRVNLAWPLFVQQYITPKFQGSLAEQLMRLRGTHKVRCDKCGCEYDYTPTSEQIAVLLREPRILCRCLNPACRDLIFPHNFPVSLGDIIYNLTTNTTS